MFKKIVRYLSDPYYALGNDMIKTCPHLMSDKFYLKVLWKLQMGSELDLRHPKTLNEKMQWLKLYDHNPLYTRLADKYEMKRVMSELYGDGVHTIPTIALYERVEDVEWEKLPYSFVIKCTHDSGSAIFCKEKSSFDHSQASRKLAEAMKRNFYFEAREWSYKHIKPRIIVEPLLSNDDGSPLVDYKFYIYGGELKYWMYSVGETEHAGTNLKFSPEKKNIDFLFKKTPVMKEEEVTFPENIDEMIDLSRRLGKGFKHVRIDMYNVAGKILIGEFTFYSNGGFINIYNQEYAQELADCIDV